jgi:hypothetical protein
MLMNLKIAEMKLLAEVLADYLQQVGNDPDRRERIEFARRLATRVDVRFFFAYTQAEAKSQKSGNKKGRQ